MRPKIVTLHELDKSSHIEVQVNTVERTISLWLGAERFDMDYETYKKLTRHIGAKKGVEDVLV